MRSAWRSSSRSICQGASKSAVIDRRESRTGRRAASGGCERPAGTDRVGDRQLRAAKSDDFLGELEAERGRVGGNPVADQQQGDGLDAMRAQFRQQDHPRAGRGSACASAWSLTQTMRSQQV